MLAKKLTKRNVNKNFKAKYDITKMVEEYSLKDMVFRAFLKNPNLGPSDMASKLNAKYNSVKATYAKLAEEGLLNREGRGNYSPNYSEILLYIMNRVEDVERQIAQR